MSISSGQAGSPGLIAAMTWLFEDHKDQAKTENKKNKHKIEELLEKVAKEGIEKTIEWMDQDIKSRFPDQPGNHLKEDDKNQLRVVLRRGGYNVKIDSMEVLRFMKELIRRESTVPPPWVR